MENYIKKVLKSSDSHTIEVSKVTLTDKTVLKNDTFYSNNGLRLFYHVPRGEGDKHFVDAVSPTACRRFFNLESLEFYDTLRCSEYIVSGICHQLKHRGFTLTADMVDKVRSYAVLLVRSLTHEDSLDLLKITEFTDDFIRKEVITDEMSGL